ncbi:MAG: heme o synthase [Phycisphaerales bacterium]|nr:heme o synthase [Phycisphaerales bacterium]
MSSPSQSETMTTQEEQESPSVSVSVFAACTELTKPGITKLVTITALVGLGLGGLHYGGLGVWDWARLIVGVGLGTAIASGGANALNMWYESDRDAMMKRTRVRPIPSRRLSPRFVLLFGLGMTILGCVILGITAGLLPALVALLTAASYVLIYTPLKPITITNTLIGAVPGALPTMIGTSAVAPGMGFEPLVEPVGLMLFCLMFLWQLPHFFAIAWMCRADYEAGGFRMLPIVDPVGNHTAATMVFTSLLLIPAGLAPLWITPELSGWGTGIASVLLGGMLVVLSLRFAIKRTDRAARVAFFGSIIHLPVYLIVMVAEAGVKGLLL